MPPFAQIFTMFGPSPINPLQAHMTKVQECVQSLLPFFEAVCNQDWNNASELQKQIAYLEHVADELKKDLRLHLPKDLFLPVSRGDLLETLTLQDKIANTAKDIAGLIIGRKMALPASLARHFIDLLQQCIAASEQAYKAIHELDELLEAGFRGKEVKLISDMIMELDRIEHVTDGLQVQLRQDLFNLEKEMPPIDVIFLYKIIEWIGDLADHAHQVGGQLQLLLAR